MSRKKQKKRHAESSENAPYVESYKNPEEKKKNKTVIAWILIIAAAAVIAVGTYLYLTSQHVYAGAESRTLILSEKGDDGKQQEKKVNVSVSNSKNLTNKKLADWYYNYVSRGEYDYYMLLVSDDDDYPKAKITGYMAAKNEGEKSYTVTGPCAFSQSGNKMYEYEDTSKSKIYLTDSKGRMIAKEQDKPGFSYVLEEDAKEAVKEGGLVNADDFYSSAEHEHESSTSASDTAAQ